MTAMNKNLDEQIKIYNRQQTPSGKRSQGQLQKMTDRLNKIEGVHVVSGTLTPVKHYRTGELSGFIES